MMFPRASEGSAARTVWKPQTIGCRWNETQSPPAGMKSLRLIHRDGSGRGVAALINTAKIPNDLPQKYLTPLDVHDIYQCTRYSDIGHSRVYVIEGPFLWGSKGGGRKGHGGADAPCQGSIPHLRGKRAARNRVRRKLSLYALSEEPQRVPREIRSGGTP